MTNTRWMSGGISYHGTINNPFWGTEKYSLVQLTRDLLLLVKTEWECLALPSLMLQDCAYSLI